MVGTMLVKCWTWRGIPAKTEHWPCVGSMLAHRLRRWANNEPTHGQCPVFAGMSSVKKPSFPVCLISIDYHITFAYHLCGAGEYSVVLQTILILNDLNSGKSNYLLIISSCAGERRPYIVLVCRGQITNVKLIEISTLRKWIYLT